MLKYRYSSDAVGVKIFDEIRQGLVYDFGRLSGLSLSQIPDGFFRTCIVNKTNNFVSQWDAAKPSLENSLASLLEAYRSQGKYI